MILHDTGCVIATDSINSTAPLLNFYVLSKIGRDDPRSVPVILSGEKKGMEGRIM